MKVVILGGNSLYTRSLYYAVSKEYQVEKVIIENSPSKIKMITKRIQKLGILTVIGQLCFKFFIEPFLTQISKKRIMHICSENHIENKPIPENDVQFVDSVNSDACIKIMRKISPDIILVMGTRIISAKVLKSISCPFVNMHMGITPLYRGVHGAYWALADGDAEHCGVTVHFVDEGIDTGAVIEQTNILPTKADNFSTYPLLQYAAGEKLFLNVLKAFSTGSLKAKHVDLPSKIRTHPTMFQYIRTYKKYKVK